MNSNAMIRYFNVIGSDPEGRLGEAPRPELREQGRISGACFDAARGIIPGLKVCNFCLFYTIYGMMLLRDKIHLKIRTKIVFIPFFCTYSLLNVLMI